MSWRDEIMTVTVRARDIGDGDRIVDPAVLASMSLDEPDAPMVTDASVERGAVTLSCAGGGVLEFAPDRLLQVERLREQPPADTTPDHHLREAMAALDAAVDTGGLPTWIREEVQAVRRHVETIHRVLISDQIEKRPAGEMAVTRG